MINKYLGKILAKWIYS